MESILPIIPAALLVLACPLGMAAFGGVVWFVARARGERKPLSMGCMGGHDDSSRSAEPAGHPEPLEVQVVNLTREVEALRSQLENGNSGHATRPEPSAAAGYENPPLLVPKG